MSIRTLFLFHVGSNAGYAIRPLEELFLRVGVRLAGGDPSGVHFAYRDLTRGPPALPIEHMIAHDFTDRRAASVEALAAYAREQRIDLVVAFDFEPIDPLVEAVKAAGVHAFVAYWGAPVSGASPRWKSWLKAARFALATSKVDALVFESEAMARTATRDRGLPGSLIEIVPLGVRTDVFRPQQTTWVYEAFGFPRSQKVVVYAGHMEPRKGVHVLVEAAIALSRRREDVAFLLCGNRAGEADAFVSRVAAAGLQRRIQFGGYRDDLPRIFPGCYAGAIASTGWDSFTYSAVEMAACGLPVVASRLQGLEEAVLDRRTGLLFTPGDARALEQAIERLLDDPPLAKRLGTAGRARVERSLSVEAQARAFEQALRRRLADATLRLELPNAPLLQGEG